ncbi:hypothetical protein EVAR_40910_1 [Eumeta japonica]|uniref:Uncharacterized protein n=1 Tax=Eumeta variegata TaxID=151549 RepID=A0A4C1X7M6_EUMVA|nr:hypothetical protein EVAR_40910_1 [Eumeta japonica]
MPGTHLKLSASNVNITSTTRGPRLEPHLRRGVGRTDDSSPTCRKTRIDIGTGIGIESRTGLDLTAEPEPASRTATRRRYGLRVGPSYLDREGEGGVRDTRRIRHKTESHEKVQYENETRARAPPCP